MGFTEPMQPAMIWFICDLIGWIKWSASGCVATFDFWIIDVLTLLHRVWTSSSWFMWVQIQEMSLRSIAIEAISSIPDSQRATYTSLVLTESLLGEKLVETKLKKIDQNYSCALEASDQYSDDLMDTLLRRQCTRQMSHCIKFTIYASIISRSKKRG